MKDLPRSRAHGEAKAAHWRIAQDSAGAVLEGVGAQSSNSQRESRGGRAACGVRGPGHAAGRCAMLPVIGHLPTSWPHDPGRRRAGMSLGACIHHTIRQRPTTGQPRRRASRPIARLPHRVPRAAWRWRRSTEPTACRPPLDASYTGAPTHYTSSGLLSWTPTCIMFSPLRSSHVGSKRDKCHDDDQYPKGCRSDVNCEDLERTQVMLECLVGRGGTGKFLTTRRLLSRSSWAYRRS